MKRSIVLAGGCAGAALLIGVVAERLLPGFGAIVSSAAGLGVVVLLLHKWKDQVTAGLVRTYWKSTEGEAAAVLAGSSQHSLLPWSDWALAPDVVLRCIGMVRVRGWNTIVECGSGVSTVLFAQQMKVRGAGHVYAIEHDAEWAKLVGAMLVERELTSWASVIVAPLQPVECDGMRFRWYDMTELGTVLALPKIDLLLIDGPKRDTNPLARYPALPTFRKQLGQEYMVVLDDGRRDDETRIAALWKDRYQIEFAFRDTTRGQWEAVS